MAEYETISLTNPTEAKFVSRFNGELYSVEAGETKNYPSFLAFHIAKHLSDKMLNVLEQKMQKTKTDNPYRPEVIQLVIHDNPKRRIALYDIFKSKPLVEQCISAFPFKGFIGEMSEYDLYVEKASKKTEKKETKE